MAGELVLYGAASEPLDPALLSLIAASLAFVGFHLVMSHPLRPWLARLGQGGFMLVYNLVIIAAFVWMIIAFRAAPTGDLGGSGELGWLLASALTLPALVLFLGSLTPRNPSMPSPGAEAAARAGPGGVFIVTRHPMMWGFALWAIAHLILWWSWRTTILGFAILVMALLGSHLQDRKKRRLMGEAWLQWEAQTSYWPRWSRLGAAGWRGWLAALLAWAVLTWVHLPLAGIPAGIWRWIG
jgi:uncharacterized membrane protein